FVLLGGSLGSGIAYLGIAFFRASAEPSKPPYWMIFKLDAVSLVYTAGLAVAATALAGLYPALKLSRPNLISTMNDAARGSTSLGLARFTRTMVVIEVALSCLMLVLSALTIRTVIKTYTAPLGFSTEGIYTGRIALSNVSYRETAKQREFYLQLIDRLRTRPEIASFGLCDLEVTWSQQNPI